MERSSRVRPPPRLFHGARILCPVPPSGPSKVQQSSRIPVSSSKVWICRALGWIDLIVASNWYLRESPSTTLPLVPQTKVRLRRDLVWIILTVASDRYLRIRTSCRSVQVLRMGFLARSLEKRLPFRSCSVQFRDPADLLMMYRESAEEFQ